MMYIITKYGEFLKENDVYMYYININDVRIEKEMILVDTKKVNDIISISNSGKMPLDKLRVMAMLDRLNNGGILPPLHLNNDKMLINGHHRYMAYKLSNINLIPVVFK